ncbi:hypothetical protein YC2023_104580 [Brassica napus]
MFTLASSIHRLAPPPSVQIFVVSGPWLEPTRTVPFFWGLPESTVNLCSSAPVNRLEPDEMLRQSHSYSQQHLLLTSAPEMASSVSGVPHLIRRAVQKARGTMRLCFPLHALIIITPSDVYLDCYSGESFCTIKGYISSPICFAAQTVHSDETSFSPAALFISSTLASAAYNFFLFTGGFIGTIYTTFITIILLSGDASPVRSGPEDATDVVSTIFRGADWILTSRYKVTKFQASSTAVSLAQTHSSHASSSLSFYLRGFSTFSFFLVNTLVSLSFPRSDQIEILLAFKNEFPILKCDFRKWPLSKQKTRSWTSKDVKSFDGVEFDNKTGVVTKLYLGGACLSGSLSADSSLFRLHHLRYLVLSHNYFDSFSFLPELIKLTKLEVLALSDMGLAGEIPSSISSLNRLTNLYLYGNELIGSFSPLLNLSKLSSLDLSSNQFSGYFPCSLLAMPFLSSLLLSRNHLIDSLETMNCSSSSKLEDLDLSYNRLSGRILEPLSKLTNLKYLYLSFQNTSDPINFVSSLGFKSLELLNLSGNAISRINPGSPNLRSLYLDNCSINEFPTFIKNLQKLGVLSIGNNRLKGEVPKWLWSMPSLMELYLSHNSFDSFQGSPTVPLKSSLNVLDLRSNAFRGSLPVISRRLSFMFASNNNFEGDIPLSLCNQSYLGLLDLSHNNFSGSIPGCLITSAVEGLNLRNNNLIGRFPDIFDKNGSLRAVDVSHNQITGQLPRSLTNSKNLEVLNVEGNRIADTFPFWLKGLPNLKIIVLRSNKFHGPIYAPQHHLSFPQLRMIDISRNRFTGSLPHDYFVNWSEPLISVPQGQEEREPLYLGYNFEYELATLSFLEYVNVSHNKLTGQIPQGTQMGGQPKSSFEGNLNLCGPPLEESCFGDKAPSTSEAQEPEPPKQEQVLNWKAAAMGYGPGVLFGLVIGHVFYSYKPVLFYKLFRL